VPSSRSRPRGWPRAVGAEVTARLQPLGVEAAIGAMHAGMPSRAEKRRQVELALEQARYEAARARRQPLIFRMRR
jgi:hypothetical protein